MDNEPYTGMNCDPNGIDLHAALMILSYTKVSKGGIKTPQVYPWVHSVS